MSSAQPSILVVDDDPIARAIMQEVLKPLSSRIVAAADGDEALRFLDVAPVDLIITDISMPKRDGIELIAEIRQRWPQTPVLAVSGGSSSVGPDLLLKTARLLGAVAVLQKPISPKVLLAEATEALGRAMAEEPRTAAN